MHTHNHTLPLHQQEFGCFLHKVSLAWLVLASQHPPGVIQYDHVMPAKCKADATMSVMMSLHDSKTIFQYTLFNAMDMNFMESYMEFMDNGSMCR